MDRTELLNAMKVIKDHCVNKGDNCKSCEIINECEYLGIAPEMWDLGDGEIND